MTVFEQALPGIRVRAMRALSVEATSMAIVGPIYSKAPYARRVYHNNDKCTERNNIESYNIAHGTGGFQLCEHCARLPAR